MGIESLTAAVIAVSILASPTSYNEVLSENDKNVITAVVENQEKEKTRIDTAIKEAKEEEQRLKEEQEKLVNLTVRPVENYSLTSRYGMRIHPITSKAKLHSGTDYAKAKGSPIAAVRRGKVIETGEDGSYGNKVVIEHLNGVKSLYAHLSEIDVEVGDLVVAGDEIGTVGNTGLSTGPHLHFEISIKGETTDSEEWLKENITSE